ncbi:MAG TPA: zinc-binding dehydrogenase [Gaiellaceae bacterium]|nr:zinc-binding dehydrogenase [Gaiellaceae bacterium]
MRAARLHELGGTPVVDEVEPPGGADVVAVSAAALNPVDVAIGTGRFYGGSPDPPYVIGLEAVGTAADGRRIWFRGNGTLAERAAAPPEHAYDVPEGVDDAAALACGIAGVTGWLAVAWRAPVRPEDTVLVLGASGTVGAAALQGARLLGARRVVGAARRTDAVPAAADDVVELAGDYELPEATLVVDCLWGEPVERAVAAAARGARVVHLGQSAGPAATLQSAWVRGKVLELYGHSLFSTAHDVIAQGYRELCEHVRDGRIRLDVARFGLDEVAAAWERQASGSPGAKVVVTL